MSRDIDRSPRPYSRLETDAELLARLDKLGLISASFRVYGAHLDKYAADRSIARRIVWCSP